MTGAEKRMKKIFEEYEKKGLRKSPYGYGKYNRNKKIIISFEWI